MRKALLACVALSLAGLGLASCGGDAAQQAETTPDGIPGVAVSNARLVLPAVKGNPGALYFDLAYGDDGATPRVALRTVEIAGAGSTQMHEYSEWNRQQVMSELVPPVIAKGEELKFEPGGKHVMAFDLDESLVAGGTAEATLTFAGGDKLSFDAEIKAAGDER